jgi:hypothetical protein
MKDYQEQLEENQKKFEGILEQLHPQLYFIYKTMRENKVSPDSLMEIVYKIGLVRDLDDGFGKVIVEMQNKTISRVRLIQEKILRPIKGELE